MDSDNLGHPVLPLELFGVTIDIIGEHSFNEDSTVDTWTTESWIDTLKSCSLVCRGFMHLTIRHIFKRRIVPFDGEDIRQSTPSHLVRRILNPGPIVTPNPTHYVQNLHIKFCSRTSQSKLLEQTQEVEFVLDTPALRSLSLSYNYHDHVSDPYSRRSTIKVTSLCWSIIKKYSDASYKTFHSLSLKGLNLAKSSTNDLGSPSLRILSITRCRCATSTFDLPLYQITELYLNRNTALPLGLLTTFPNLRVLCISECLLSRDQRALKSLMTDVTQKPPLELKSFSFEVHSSGWDIVDFFEEHGLKHGIDPWGKLNCNMLSISFINPTVPRGKLAALLQRASLLRHLTLAVMVPASTTNNLLDSLAIYQEMVSARSLMFIRSLSLRIKHYEMPVSTELSHSPFTNLSTILTAVTPNSALEKLKITMRTQETATEALWGHLATFSTNSMKFPKPRVLQVEIIHHPAFSITRGYPGSKVLKETDQIVSQHIQSMKSAMQSAVNETRGSPQHVITSDTDTFLSHRRPPYPCQEHIRSIFCIKSMEPEL
ncbi:hypothetical protein CVT24_010402 [Panaeolus cyanescens]|uniref:Uncharacterized protein n=1 Tax=Panaeolus cyanescens TaxID=181874 RepID=A0A409X2P5_9AGAR|nr:hypothetical protein CVT24_010402 [Panaeolus cyanescens]